MANLVIDIGNSLIKVAVFKGEALLNVQHYQAITTDQLSKLVDSFNIGSAIISSVKKNKETWKDELAINVPLTYFTRDMAKGINNHYATPQTLGIDRLVGVFAAHCLHPDKGNLVIDAGTCITYDYVDATGNYFGGSISPGLNMRFKAMHNYTSALPLVQPDQDFSQYFGNTTATAMQSGVQNGVQYELKGFIESYCNNSPDMNILITGGDGIFFDNLLKNSIFAPQIKIEPYLVLKGLNVALQQHND